MASETPKYKIPYPEAPDVPDIAGDLQKLAAGVETALGSGIASGVWGQGSMANFPPALAATAGTEIYVDPTSGKLYAAPTPTVRHASDPIGSYSANFKVGASPAPYWYRWGPVVMLVLRPQRITSALSASAEIGKLATGVPLPVAAVSTVNAGVAPMAGITLDTNGSIRVGNLAPSGSWAVNVTWTLSFTYMTADEVLI